MQATKGDNKEERPMWAEKGGLDFEGRAKWDAWTAVKGTPANKAMLAFVKVVATATLICFFARKRAPKPQHCAGAKTNIFPWKLPAVCHGSLTGQPSPA